MNSITEILRDREYQIGGLFCSVLFVYLSKRLYFDGGRCKSGRRLDGKTAIITGSNTGIGKETALELARRGARVILACRDAGRANQAAQQIRAESGNGNVVVEIVDLASFESIRNFADRINKNNERIDILVNNGGRYFIRSFNDQ